MVSLCWIYSTHFVSSLLYIVPLLFLIYKFVAPLCLTIDVINSQNRIEATLMMHSKAPAISMFSRIET